MAKGKKRKLHAADDSSKSNVKAKNKSATTSTKAREPTIPFHAEDRILLIGEGDFSFAKSIVEHHGCYEVTATCFDSPEVLFSKYDPQAKQHVQYLEDESQTVLYNVDATKLDQNKQLRNGSQYDAILFNFPHELLVKFFKSTSSLLAEGGKIVVTLFEGEPYSLWNVRDLARHAELEVQRTFKFVAEAYPGYSHARTLGNIDGGGGWKGEDREAKSFVFQRKGADATKNKKPNSKNAKRKRPREEDSSDDEG
ncbi:hypothetical protein LTR78_009584 [Recurvomyces mirabilis]|uniref:25S rRNA (uridine-N(3))-methyltransferase BMT5-like domain-containing protein n=1 Tax=Recurvomyces mirabilis TaxID=574656 RepID=A0AAE0WIE4_9PEZI|nr:hypothetical protein LTR78_009584 [Recurvomyces mirabilis]KAK5156583.1 hypothetical protein LTS14_004795 [Recurvomyces mirabilis]